MKLLVIVLCLLSERYLIHAISYQRFNWFHQYAQALLKYAHEKKLPTDPRALLIILAILPVFITLLIYIVLSPLFFGLFGFIINIVLFYYCIGPQNPFYPTAVNDTSEEGLIRGIGCYLSQVNRELFTVIFWYVLLGPVAALAYRLISLLQRIEPTSEPAHYITDILEWAPARITSILYLLVGNFQSGIQILSQYIIAVPQNNEMLELCGIKAVQNIEEKELSMLTAEHIVEHATVLFLVIIAFFTLASWM